MAAVLVRSSAVLGKGSGRRAGHVAAPVPERAAVARSPQRRPSRAWSVGQAQGWRDVAPLTAGVERQSIRISAARRMGQLVAAKRKSCTAIASYCVRSYAGASSANHAGLVSC